jgi:hypothetical protein
VFEVYRRLIDNQPERVLELYHSGKMGYFEA